MARIVEFSPQFSSRVKSFVLGILEGEFGLKGTRRPDLDDIAGTYQKNKGNFWVALEGARVVGTIALLDCGERRGYLKRTYISSEYRGQGLAGELLDTFIRFAGKQGFSEIYCGTVEEMAAANKFYPKHGFKKINALPDDLPGFGDSVFYRLDLQNTEPKIK